MRIFVEEIHEIFNKAHELIKPFLEPKVLQSSVFDGKNKEPYTKAFVEKALEERKQQVLERALEI